jgi:hypothetical protein
LPHTIRDTEFRAELKSRILFVQRDIDRLQKEEKLLRELILLNGDIIPSEDPQHNPSVIKSSEKLPPRQIASRREATKNRPEKIHEEIIKFILSMIREKGTWVNVKEIWNKMEGNIDCSKAELQMCLSMEVGKNGDARIKRIAHGMYDRIGAPIKVVDKRSKEEIAIEVQKARENEEISRISTNNL